MKILALDSSGMTASAAILEDGILRAEYTVNIGLTHSQTLLPMIDTISKMTGIKAEELDAIAIAAGPGSFTGLRIGSATAKGIGLAWDIPIVSVQTVDALAYNLYGTEGLICPMMDARRQQVYTGLYRFAAEGFRTESRPDELPDANASEECAERDEICPGSRCVHLQMETVMEQCPTAVEELAEKINHYGEKVTLLGDGVPVYRDLLKKILQVPWTEAPAHLNRQRAGAVAALAMQRLCGDSVSDGGNCQILHPELLVPARDHVPVYLRLSQAERERAEKEKAEKKDM